jgi:ABC-type multidrug transport system fused ATPase/permease subunit
VALAAVVLAGVTGRTPAATVAAAMTLVGLLVAPLRDLGRIQEYWYTAQAASEKLGEMLVQPTGLVEPVNPPRLKSGAGRLHFGDVTLQGALHGVTVTAEPGQVVAIVGPNGAGKTTLLALAARLLEPDGGRVFLDGQDLAHHAAADVRAQLGLVGPDLPLLRGTVERNLRYRRPDSPPEEVLRVMAVCEVDEVVAALPDGLATRIAEGGAGLSAGQRQRLALARALLGNPAVLLLDEADANLDREASAVVDRVLAQHRGTVLVVTHRPERLASADVIWHLDAGRVVEVGSPAELLAGDGPTARLFGDDRRVGAGARR